VSFQSEELPGKTRLDEVLGFTLPERNARGRVVRLGPVLDEVLAAHAYPAPVRHLLSEALVLTALIGSLLKELDSQLTVQAQADGGIVDLLVCDYRAGELRGYVRHDPDKLGKLGANLSLETLFGEGYLAMTFDLTGTKDRYQGIVPLEGRSLSEACERYFERTEQIPIRLRAGIRQEGEHSIAGGFLVQHLAAGEEGRVRLDTPSENVEWEHVSTLSASIRHEELVDGVLSLEGLVWRLFHEESEIRVEHLCGISRGCRCTVERFREVLARFSVEEMSSMKEADDHIPVECAFCSKIFAIDV